MEKEEYNILIQTNQLSSLAQIRNTNDLINYQYQDKYLLDYLLEQNIHTKEMDQQIMFSDRWLNYYLRYNILDPILNCPLRHLLKIYDNTIILDLLLGKLDNSKRIKLYENLKSNSYWCLHDNEDLVINIFKKHHITLPRVFTRRNNINTIDNENDIYLLQKVQVLFSDHDNNTINILLSELKRSIKVDYTRTIIDIKKLINYKEEHPNFTIVLSNNINGLYDKDKELMEISPFRTGVFSHELSHFLFENEKNDLDIDYLVEYENLCQKFNSDEYIKNIKKYLENFHKRYYEMAEYFKELYNSRIQKQYHSLTNYIKVLCNDIRKYEPSIIDIKYDTSMGFFVDDSNVEDIVVELIQTEKEEYVKEELSNYYSEELLLENLLDALLHGKIFDNMIGIECLSGHSFFQFISNESLSFDECLADYDAIIKSFKKNKIINDLKMLVGNDLIELLDNYIEEKRKKSYGI